MVVVSLLEEFSHRAALKIALSGRDEVTFTVAAFSSHFFSSAWSRCCAFLWIILLIHATILY